MSAGEPNVTFEPEAAVSPSIGDSASAGARRIILARLGSLAIVFVGAIILSRTLGPENRGAHAFYVALVTLLAAILGLSASTGGYVLSGRARIYFGEKFEDYLDMEEGDWVFVPPFMPHIECNLDRNNPLTWMTTRTPENIVVNLDDVPDEDLRDWLTR